MQLPFFIIFRGRDFIILPNIKYNENIIDSKLEQYSPFVNKIVKDLNISIPSGLNREDIVVFGLKGLYNALVTFDMTKSKSFPAYAKHKIRFEIIDSIRKFSSIPRTVLDKKKTIERAINILESKLCRIPTADEMREYLGLTENQYLNYMQSFNYGIEFSLNNVFQSSNDEVEEYFEHKQKGILDIIEENELIDNINKTINCLSEKERQVMQLRYKHSLTYKQIAYIMGISDSTVGEIHNRVILYLKSKFNNENN